MKRALPFLGVFILAFCGVASDARGIPIPIIFGNGEEMTEMGELPSEVSRDVENELGTRVTVAFLYEHVHVYYLDVWTWNGRYVLHSGNKYWEPGSDKWQKMIGGEPSDKYGKPILYRIPLLTALLSVIVAGAVLRKLFFKTDQEKLAALMNDKRYQRALETVFGKNNDEESAVATTTLDRQRFLNAKNQLISEGVDIHAAESNLQTIVDAILANTNARIDAYLELASQLDQKGDWDRSADVYSRVISSLPDADDRKVRAQICLASVNEKRAAKAAGQSDPMAPE